MGVGIALAVGVGLLGAGIQAAQQDKANQLELQAAELNTEAQLAQINTQIENVQRDAERKTLQVREAGEYNIGATKSAFGASGVRLEEGTTPMQQLATRRSRLEEDIQYISDTAARNVASLEEQRGFVERGGELNMDIFKQNESNIAVNTFLGSTNAIFNPILGAF